MHMHDADKIFTPGINIFVGKWYSFYTIFFHERMRFATDTIGVEFFFKQLIYCFVYVEWWA